MTGRLPAAGDAGLVLHQGRNERLDAVSPGSSCTPPSPVTSRARSGHSVRACLGTSTAAARKRRRGQSRFFGCHRRERRQAGRNFAAIPTERLEPFRNRSQDATAKEEAS